MDIIYTSIHEHLCAHKYIHIHTYAAHIALVHQNNIRKYQPTYIHTYMHSHTYDHEYIHITYSHGNIYLYTYTLLPYP
jgi:hypothetical protein